MHNPDCTHGYVHRPDECRDRYGMPLKDVPEPISVPEPADEATGDPEDALAILRAAADAAQAEEDPE